MIRRTLKSMRIRNHLRKFRRLSKPHPSFVHYDSWLEAYYSFGHPIVPLFVMKLDDVVNFTGVSFSKDSAHPFIVALRHATEAGDGTCMESDIVAVLESYYDTFRPFNLQGVIGLSEGLHTASTVQVSRDGTKNVGGLSGKKVTLPWDEGVRNLDRKYIGPRTATQIRGTARRLLKVYTSLRECGWNPERDSRATYDAHPSGQVLLPIESSGRPPRFLLKSGHHRLAALAVLGESNAEVGFRPAMPPIIRQRDIHYWPQVRRGSSSVGSARDVFLGLTSGRNSRIEGWRARFTDPNTPGRMIGV